LKKLKGSAVRGCQTFASNAYTAKEDVSEAGKIVKRGRMVSEQHGLEFFRDIFDSHFPARGGHADACELKMLILLRQWNACSSSEIAIIWQLNCYGERLEFSR